MKKSLSRLTAVLLLAFILAVTLTLPLEADHDCNGDDCPVCALLDSAGRLLISGAPPSPVAARVITQRPLLLVPALALCVCLTPVAQRTRMND